VNHTTNIPYLAVGFASLFPKATVILLCSAIVEMSKGKLSATWLCASAAALVVSATAVVSTIAVVSATADEELDDAAALVVSAATDEDADSGAALDATVLDSATAAALLLSAALELELTLSAPEDDEATTVTPDPAAVTVVDPTKPAVVSVAESIATEDEELVSAAALATVPLSPAMTVTALPAAVATV
jgi:hypothetical protein